MPSKSLYDTISPAIKDYTVSAYKTHSPDGAPLCIRLLVDPTNNELLSRKEMWGSKLSPYKWTSMKSLFVINIF
jgi:hypothetical protein